MEDSEFRSRRIWIWASYEVEVGECRFQDCRNDEISHTDEGDMCLEHYIGLPECSKCGMPACGSWEPILCMNCQDMTSSMGVIMSTSSSLENEGGFLEIAYGNKRNEIGIFERKLGRTDLISWAMQIMRRSIRRMG